MPRSCMKETYRDSQREKQIRCSTTIARYFTGIVLEKFELPNIDYENKVREL